MSVDVDVRTSGPGGERTIELNQDETMIITKALRVLLNNTADAYSAVRQAGARTDDLSDHFGHLKNLEERFSQAIIDIR